jgi:hypothetical protein
LVEPVQLSPPTHFAVLCGQGYEVAAIQLLLHAGHDDIPADIVNLIHIKAVHGIANNLQQSNNRTHCV